jgi:hypothetical protein
MKQGKINVCWQGQQFYSLPYESAGGYGGDEYIKYGHDPYKVIINNDVYVGPKEIMPEFWKGVVEQLPDHDHFEVAIYRTPPANILPLHKDMYANFMKMHNITDVNTITRYIVFLEDCKLGHYFHVEDTCLCDWKNGDWISWTGSAPHAAYNMGIEHRFTMQVTAFDR